MRYFEKQWLAFFHIPKTGGTSFTTFLRKKLGESRHIKKFTHHEPLLVKKEILGDELFNKLIIITLIRNPYANLVSHWAWVQQIKSNSKYPHIAELKGVNFPEFVDWHFENYNSYSDFILINEEIPPNLRIIRLEYLEKDTNKILNNELGLNLQLDFPHIHKTSHAPFMDYYTNDLLNKVNKKYEWTFDMGFYSKKENIN